MKKRKNVSGRISIQFTVKLDEDAVDVGLDADGEFFDLVGGALRKEDFDSMVHDLVRQIKVWTDQVIGCSKQSH